MSTDEKPTEARTAMAAPSEKDVGVTSVSAAVPFGSTGNYEEGVGDLQVLKVSDSDNVKVDKDGVTVLIPQPSDDPNDPVSVKYSSSLESRR